MSLARVPAQVPDEAELAGRVSEMFRSAGLTPPTARELAADSATRRIVERLVQDGVLVRAVDQSKGKELLFHRLAIAEAKRLLEPQLAQEPGLLVTEIGEVLGISRKFSLPLLGYLDQVRFTRRIGDRRVLWASGESEGVGQEPPAGFLASAANPAYMPPTATR